ncbi:progestin and adipoQ receptor family member 4 [Calliopsis andreniformis]|uniref:progestin and adipoQ receptor family member 4 n=1 Tax=Calliopsis andreniformis TaxID=337506 RepID=UPI003FCD3464
MCKGCVLSRNEKDRCGLRGNGIVREAAIVDGGGRRSIEHGTDAVTTLPSSSSLRVGTFLSEVSFYPACTRASNIPQERLGCTTTLRDDVHHAEAPDPPLQDITSNKDVFNRQDCTNGRMHEHPPQQEKSKICLLRRWSDMPKHLQFNPHIHTGYRPLMTVGQCLGSLFYIHNETVNIITHGFAILYMLLTIPQLLPWSTQGTLMRILSWCHLIGAVSPWIGSFLYHLFMNLNYDEVLYRKLLKLDMIGIWLCQSFGAIPMIAASVHCLPDICWYCCMFIYCFLSIWGLLKAMNALSPWERRLCFAPPFLMRMLVMTLRLFGIGGGSPDALLHIVLQDLIAVVGAIIGALRIPEKWIPGKLDLALNSHNLMHVLVVLAVCSMHAATLQDLLWMTDPSTCNGTNFVPSRHDEL